jgi:arabinan endo-1,5-alpha-L-arabinosidase
LIASAHGDAGAGAPGSLQGQASLYVPPQQVDDYAAQAGWEHRSAWNLANTHDPTIVFDGTYYYMYWTDATYGNAHLGHGHFPYRRSLDLVHWDFMGMAMEDTPPWVLKTLNDMRSRDGLDPITEPRFGHWAPVVRKVGETYRLYYSIIVDNYIQSGLPNTPENFDHSWTERAFIGLMEADDLEANAWVDKGMVVCSVSDRGGAWSRKDRRRDWDGYFRYNAIDPSYIVTPRGEHYLVYGSWHSGIVLLQIDPGSGKPLKPLETVADYGVRIAARFLGNPDNRWQGLEAPELIYNKATGYYYLFLAYDELSVAYNTRVCRSKNVEGPYLGIDGGNVTEGEECWPILTHPYRFNHHPGWVGLSHCCVVQNPASGDWFYCSQGRLPHATGGNPHSNAIMMGHVRKMRWTDEGWPVVMPQRYAAVPQRTITEDEFVGTWEHILLNHAYRSQQVSQALTLNEDRTAEGPLTGTWSFDPQARVLVIGRQALYVERELDWEASPRVPTLVYAGLNPEGRSLWGKQVKKAGLPETPAAP